MNNNEMQNEKDETSNRNDYVTYITLMHLSSLLAYPLGIIGAAAPIIMWQVKAKESQEVNYHGRNIANFMISMIIYAVIAFVLCFFVIGFALFILLALFGIICIIVAAVKASKGIYWQYPATIKFFR